MADAAGDIGLYAFALDFDGTLADIAPTPDAVRVDPGLPPLLDALSGATGGAVAIVTGRAVAAIDAFLGRPDLDVCGLHGLDRRIGGRRAELPFPDLTPEIAALERELAACPGIIIESKGVGVAVHWRLAPDHEARAVAALDQLAARLGPAYRVQAGKAVRELVPAASGKGAAVRALMGAVPYAGRIPLMAGDDRTDESAFAATGQLGGVAVKIGPGETGAARRLASPGELRERLRVWLDGGEGPGGWPNA